MREIVYLIDDNTEFTDTVKDLIDRKGVFDEVRIFNDPAEFIQHMNPDVWVTVVDYQMHKLNGLEVTEQIRAINPDCLIIIVSISDQYSLPPSLYNKWKVQFVSKSDATFINKIITMAKAFFKEQVPSLISLRKYE